MTVTERLDKHDKQIAAIRDLVKEGVRMVVETRRLALETRKDLRELAAAQKRTDESLRALIDSLRGGGNGHTKRHVD
jgi:Spy/CpxP family protein refolding chaperone